MDNVVSILARERASAQARVDSLSVEMRDLRQRVREIDDAITVLSGHTPDVRSARGSGGKLQSMILACLKAYGPAGASVRDIAASLALDGRETSEPSVSSTLSRMKGESEVENRQGRWFAKIEIQDSNDLLNEPDEVEAPADTRASYGRVAELEGPEKTEQRPIRIGENVGSSPTPPSPVQLGSYTEDLDDDIPF